MDSSLEADLRNKWDKSELSSVIGEQEPAAIGSHSNLSFTKLCPEVAYDRFGWFASGLYTYGDSTDVESAHTKLNRTGDGGESWRWTWATITPMHYTECPLYSLLLHAPGNTAKTTQDSDREIFQLKPSLYGFGIDLKALVFRIKRIFQRKH